MDIVQNPYAPGAGTPPPELAGRSSVLEDARTSLLRIQSRRPSQSLILVGLRGVGKTVLLVKMREMAVAIGYKSIMIEATENRTFPSLIVPPLRQALLSFNTIEAAKDKARRGLRVLVGFVRCFRLHLNDPNITLIIEPELGAADSGDLETDLANLFSVVGEAAAQAGASLSLLIDELQYLSKNDFSALMIAMQRVSQENSPITMIGAGLPQIHGLAGASRSYSERLFRFPPIGALRDEDAQAALVNPANQIGIKYNADAIDAILDVTEKYPYFLQQWGYDVWNIVEGPVITKENVVNATEVALKTLDEGFFKVCFDRCTPAERKYLRAMAEFGPSQHRSGDIADKLGVKVTSVGPTRSSLIRKGMIYSPQHGDNAFTVPMFDEYMRRAIPMREKKDSRALWAN